MENFSINKKTTKQPAEVSYIFLDMKGNLVKDSVKILPNIRDTYFISEYDKDRVGKIEDYKERKKFFLKTIKFGSSGEILSDPINSTVFPAYTDTDNRSRTFEYTQVSEETFYLYVKYLKTGNTVYFHNIVRRFNNGEA